MADSKAADVSFLYETAIWRYIATAAAGLLCTEQLHRKIHLTVPKFGLRMFLQKRK